MKFIIFLALSSGFLIFNSYLLRTKVFSKKSLQHFEEYLTNNDRSSQLRFCRMKGYIEVAYVKMRENEIESIVCANH
jgi:hypothetical protein